MNLGILEGLQAHGASGDTTCMEMLPGNHKDELPLIHFVPTLPHHFCCPVFILIYLFFICLSSLSILNFLPPHRSFSNRLRQVHCSLWPEIHYFLSQAPKLKGVTLSRQARAMHNRPFSRSIPWHYAIPKRLFTYLMMALEFSIPMHFCKRRAPTNPRLESM